MKPSTATTMLLALVALASARPLGAGATAPTKTGRADRIFVNGRVWTGDPGKPLVQALAVRGATVLELGTSEEIRKLAGKGTDVVDLRGRFACPASSTRTCTCWVAAGRYQSFDSTTPWTWPRSRRACARGCTRTPRRAG